MLYIIILFLILIILISYYSNNKENNNNNNIILLIFVCIILLYNFNKYNNINKCNNENFQLVKYNINYHPVNYKDIIYEPIYVWSADTVITRLPFNIQYFNGAQLSTTYLETKFNNRNALEFKNTTKLNIKPIKYVCINILINPANHNTIFLLVRTKNRISNINLYIANTEGIPMELIGTKCNTFNNNVNGNSNYLGPYNNTAVEGYYEWISFPVNINLINKYKDSSNKINICLNEGEKCNENIILSGIATAINPFEIDIFNSWTIYYNINVYKLQYKKWIKTKLRLDNWADDLNIFFNKSQIYKIELNIINNKYGIILGFISQNNTWYDTNPIIYINDNYNVPYRLNNFVIGRYGMSLLGRNLHRHPRGIFIPKSIISSMKSNSNNTYTLSVTISNVSETYDLVLRGLYVEAVYSNIEKYNTNTTNLIPYDKFNLPISYYCSIYNDPHYFWDGTNVLSNDIITNFIPNNSTSIVDTSQAQTLDDPSNNLIYKRFIKITGTTMTNDVPTNYVTCKIPIISTSHNTLFIQVPRSGGWTVFNICIINTANNVIVKKVLTTTSTNNSENTSLLGPFNNIAIESSYIWLPFPIPKEYNTYATNNLLTISINRGGNGREDMYIYGMAVATNPYALTTLQAIDLHWNLNGVTIKSGTNWVAQGVTWNNENWNNDLLCHIHSGEIFRIKVPILNNDKDLLIGIVTHGNTWYDCNPRIFINGDDSKTYYLSPLVIGKYGFYNNSRGIYRHPRGFVVNKNIIDQYMNKIDPLFKFIEIIIDNNYDTNAFYIRTIYTEALTS